MNDYTVDEINIINNLRSKVQENHEYYLSDKDLNLLSQIFSDRFERAVKIVEESKVTRYTFKPSYREVWTVKGKGGTYQVMPITLYCSCDDFYFRVLGRKRGVCYHVLSQFLAFTSKKFNDKELPDIRYRDVVERTKV